VLFVDLGNTPVWCANISERFVAFPETDIILSNLMANELELGIIFDGSRSQ
jgi:hypothetical protein